jgi:nicotinamidase-related amidase
LCREETELRIDEDTALLVIDIQNDYFPGGQFPLWQAEETLTNIETAVERLRKASAKIILVQHVADSKHGQAPFFNDGTQGVKLHERIVEAGKGAPVVVKSFADSFYGTNLLELLKDAGIRKLIVCGMMTQNCVTHTAVSKSAEMFEVSILADCCTTVSEILHQIALHGISTRVPLIELADLDGSFARQHE